MPPSGAQDSLDTRCLGRATVEICRCHGVQPSPQITLYFFYLLSWWQEYWKEDTISSVRIHTVEERLIWRYCISRLRAGNVSNCPLECKWRAEQYWLCTFCLNDKLLSTFCRTMDNALSDIIVNLWYIYSWYFCNYMQIFKSLQIKKWGSGLQTVSNHSVLRLPFSFWDVVMISSSHTSDLSFTESTAAPALVKCFLISPRTTPVHSSSLMKQSLSSCFQLRL